LIEYDLFYGLVGAGSYGQLRISPQRLGREIQHSPYRQDG
jgi:hypothetical protein